MVDYRRRTGTRADRSSLTAEVVAKKASADAWPGVDQTVRGAVRRLSTHRRIQSRSPFNGLELPLVPPKLASAAGRGDRRGYRCLLGRSSARPAKDQLERRPLVVVG